MLLESFTEKEMKEAIFQIEHNKAQGSDGFHAEFYQFFKGGHQRVFDRAFSRVS